MITDAFCVFFDEPAAATGTSKTVYPGLYAGRGEPINVTTVLKGANAAAVNMDITVQESKDGTTWATLGVVKLAKPNAKPTVLTFTLPRNTKETQVRLTYTLTGVATGLTLWSGVTRDHFAPYDEGLFIDAGEVVA